MKRVLMVAYFFPPLANSGTQRPLKFSTYLPEYGWEPIVLTVDRPPDSNQDLELEKEVRPGTRIVRAPMLSDVLGGAASVMFPRRARERVAENVSWRLRRRVHIPDLYALWRPTARRAALRVFKDVGFDAVWATGFPWTSLLIGRDIARLTRRPFVADFRDPWNGDDVFGTALSPARRHRQLALERSVVRHASAVVSVSDAMTEQMRTIHADVQASRFITIHNGYDPADLTGCDPAPRSDKKFRVVYTGVWKTGYGLDELYTAIAQLASTCPGLAQNLEVIAAGFEPGEATRRGLAHIIREVGLVSHASALGWMQSADALFLTAAGPEHQQHHIPGKLFEYLGVRRPIIALADPGGETGRLIQRTGGGLVIPKGDRDLLVHTLHNASRNGVLAVAPYDFAALSAYQRSALTARLAMVLDSVQP